MHKPSVTQLIYRTLYPRPTQKDPPSFAQFVSRLLVQEVRTETTNFYGALDCVEAQYPGLDYSYIPHRQRLWRFENHRRLFQVFDKLGLTRNEIYAVCQWEGTKSAKDKYERDAGRKIRDTTMDAIAPAEVKKKPMACFHEEEEEHSDISEDESRVAENEVEDSYGVQLNEQLRAAADAQARGEPVVFDEQWEQWMKEAMERNELGVDAILDAIRQNRPFPITPSLMSEPTEHDTFHEPAPLVSVTTPETTVTNHSTTSTSTQTTPRLSNTQEAMVNSLRRLESTMSELVTASVTAATADPPAAEAR